MKFWWLLIFLFSADSFSHSTSLMLTSNVFQVFMQYFQPVEPSLNRNTCNPCWYCISTFIFYMKRESSCCVLIRSAKNEKICARFASNILAVGMRTFLWSIFISLTTARTCNRWWFVFFFAVAKAFLADFYSFVSHLFISLSDLISTACSTTCFPITMMEDMNISSQLKGICDSNQSSQ